MVQREAEPDVVAPSSLPPDDSAEFGAWVEPELLAMTRLARRLAPHGDPEDVVQDALARAWRKRTTYAAERGTPTAWLLAITADQARATRRRRVRHLRHVDDAAEVLDGATVDPGRDLDLERAVTRLPPRQRLAVELHYFVGLGVADTAAAMACSAGTVKSTLHDARARLRSLLGDDT